MVIRPNLAFEVSLDGHKAFGAKYQIGDEV